MGAFLTALLSTGNQLGEAKSQVEEERLRRQEKLRGMNIQDAYLQLAKQRETREAEAEKAAIARGERLLVQGRWYDIKQQKFLTPEPPDPYAALKDLLATVPLEQRAGAVARMRAVTAAEPNRPEAGVQAALAYLNTQQAESNRREDQEKSRQFQEHEATERRTFQEGEATKTREFREEESKKQRDFQRQMVDYRLNEKSRFMTSQERQQWESIKNLEPMVSKLGDFLEANKLTEENAYVFGDHSALMQHLRMRGYKSGVKQEAVSQELIKDAAAISIMGAAPWVRIGRGRYTLEQIQQHLPKPTDTPGNLYDKVTWLRDEVIGNAKQSLEGLTPPGETQTSPDQGGDRLDINKLLGTKDVEQGPK